MPYRLQADEKIPQGIERISREQIDRAVAELSDSELGRQEGVHQARKRFKKIRKRMQQYWESWQAENSI